MVFPVSILGQVQIGTPGQSVTAPQQILKQIETGLLDLGARDVVVQQESLAFRLGMFRFATGRNPIRNITSGSLQVVNNEKGQAIKYTLWFTEHALFMVAMMLVIPAIDFLSHDDPWTFLLVVLPIYPIAVAITVWRFRRFLRWRSWDRSMPV